jgi:voltage-gated potassium channel
MKPIQKILFTIIFGTNTKAGKMFDVILLWTIIGSVIVVMLDSVEYFHTNYHFILYLLEWLFTILFTIEYILRIYSTPKKSTYILSFWGVIDFLSILPTYFSIVFVGYQYLLIVRILRLLRIFRILKLTRFNVEAQMLITALKLSMYKITFFFSFVLTLVTLMGTLMYVIEGGEHGFNSIPQSIYWAIITLTTVGYGDIVPTTVMGKFLASFIMISGYAIIAVPTGIVTVELSKVGIELNNNYKCKVCKHINPKESNYCNKCGNILDNNS